MACSKLVSWHLLSVLKPLVYGLGLMRAQPRQAAVLFKRPDITEITYAASKKMRKKQDGDKVVQLELALAFFVWALRTSAAQDKDQQVKEEHLRLADLMSPGTAGSQAAGEGAAGSTAAAAMHSKKRIKNKLAAMRAWYRGPEGPRRAAFSLAGLFAAGAVAAGCLSPAARRVGTLDLSNHLARCSCVYYILGLAFEIQTRT